MSITTFDIPAISYKEAKINPISHDKQESSDKQWR